MNEFALLFDYLVVMLIVLPFPMMHHLVFNWQADERDRRAEDGQQRGRSVTKSKTQITLSGTSEKIPDDD